MLKKFTAIAAFAAAFGLVASAQASTVSGRVTASSPTSISVLDKEMVTVGINDDTVFTKLVTQKPWQEDIALTASAVRVGAFVVVHVPENSGFIANWVQVGDFGKIDYAPVAPVARLFSPGSESKRPGAVDTAAYRERVAAIGHAPAVIASVTNAAPANTEAAFHRAEASKRRANPNASESKRPGGVDTAAHCDRMARELENAK